MAGYSVKGVLRLSPAILAVLSTVLAGCVRVPKGIGPFYASYVIFDLDGKDYQYAFVCGPNRSYLWLPDRSTRN